MKRRIAAGSRTTPAPWQTWLGLAALVSCAATATAGGSGGAPACTATAEDPAFEAAQWDYEIGHHARAFAQLAALADAGHGPAARLAADMVRFGPRLYGQHFEVAPQRLARWRQGRPDEVQGRCPARSGP